MRALVSLALVDAERRRESFARTQGWEETWMLGMISDSEEDVYVLIVRREGRE
jgi:hypothetical protein